MKKHKVKKMEEPEKEEKVEDVEEKDEVEEVEETSDSEMPKFNQDADEDAEEEKDEDEVEPENIKPDEVVKDIPLVAEAEQCTRLNPKVKMYLGVGLLGAVLLGVAIGFLIYYFTGFKTTIEVPVVASPISTPVDVQQDPTATGEAPGPITAANLTSEYPDEIKVTWESQAYQLSDIEADVILKQVDPNGKYYEGIKKASGWTDSSKLPAGFGEDHLALFKAGTVKAPAQLANKQLYYWFVPVLPQEMGESFSKFLVFVDGQNRLVKIVSDAKDNQTDDYQLLSGYVVKTFPELLPDKTLTKNGSDIKLVYEDWYGSSRSSAYDSYENILGLKSIWPYLGSNYGDMKDVANGTLSESDKVFKSEQGVDVYYKDGCYITRFPNGAWAVYNLELPFSIKNIIWKAEKQPSDDGYTLYREGTDCGGMSQCPLVADKEKWFNVKNLVEIGATLEGQSVYELSDKATNEFYKSYYSGRSLSFGDDNVSVEAYNKLSDTEKYQKFLDSQPLFFWQDPLEHWVVFTANRYQSMAECGKPVIYLYPEKEMDVKVMVAPNGGFKITEPEYGTNGWTVRATPQSDLFNYADKITYPYLFWEGHAYNMSMPTEGFVMKKSDVGTKMNIILGKLGLNAKEIKDFMEFWQPKLEVKPYVFVTFISQTEFDKLAPLTVTPAPDKVIRVFMDYAPLDQPANVRPMKITTPVRTGFTVVEWGGRLHN